MAEGSNIKYHCPLIIFCNIAHNKASEILIFVLSDEKKLKSKIITRNGG